MGQSTVTKFAVELGLPVDLLIEQLKSAGVNKSAAEDFLTEVDKSALLEYLRKEHGQSQTPKNKITLTHKQNKEIKKQIAQDALARFKSRCVRSVSSLDVKMVSLLIHL